MSNPFKKLNSVNPLDYLHYGVLFLPLFVSKMIKISFKTQYISDSKTPFQCRCLHPFKVFIWCMLSVWTPWLFNERNSNELDPIAATGWKRGSVVWRGEERRGGGVGKAVEEPLREMTKVRERLKRDCKDGGMLRKF